MLKVIRAIYDDGEIKLLGEKLRGKYEVILIFLETLPGEGLQECTVSA